MTDRPIRGLNCDMRTLEQACAELGLNVADYRAARGEPRIVTTNVRPPIGCTDHDWSAHYEGEEDFLMDMGWGATEAEAVKDLRENFPRGGEA